MPRGRDDESDSPAKDKRSKVTSIISKSKVSDEA